MLEGGVGKGVTKNKKNGVGAKRWGVRAGLSEKKKKAYLNKSVRAQEAGEFCVCVCVCVHISYVLISPYIQIYIVLIGLPTVVANTYVGELQAAFYYALLFFFM